MIRGSVAICVERVVASVFDGIGNAIVVRVEVSVVANTIEVCDD